MTTDIKELKPEIADLIKRLAESDKYTNETAKRNVVREAVRMLGKLGDMVLSTQTAEPIAYTWMNIPKGGGKPVKEIGFTAPTYIPTDKLTPLYTHPAKTEQPSLSDEQAWDIYVKATNAVMNTGGRTFAIALTRAILAQRQDSDTPAIGEQCVSSSGPIGCYRVRCHLGKVCAAIANGAPK